MTAASGRLALHPERCDQCGRCVRACPKGILRIASGYIYVDVTTCDGCFACGEVCDKGAISLAGKGDSSHVAVGSRAEAKALRKAAKGEKPATRSSARGSAHDGVAPDDSTRGDATPRQPAKRGGRVAETRPDTASVRWSLLEGVTVAVVAVSALIANDAVMSSAPIQAMPDVGRVVARTVVLGIFYAAQLGVLALLASRHHVAMREAFRLRVRSNERAQAPDVSAGLASAGLVLVMLVATRLVSTLWGAAAQGIGWNPPTADPGGLTQLFGAGGLGLALSVLMVVLIGPFAEELLFRGVIAHALRERWGTRAAIVVSAAVFALCHVTPWLFVPMFALGCASAWLALERKTLWPAIALHALYNGVVVGAAFWLAR